MTAITSSDEKADSAAGSSNTAGGVRISASWSGARNAGCGTPNTSRSARTALSANRWAPSWVPARWKRSLGLGPSGVGGSHPISTMAATCPAVSWKYSPSWVFPDASAISPPCAAARNATNGGSPECSPAIAPMVRVASSSMTDRTSDSFVVKEAHAWSVLLSMSKSETGAASSGSSVTRTT